MKWDAMTFLWRHCNCRLSKSAWLEVTLWFDNIYNSVALDWVRLWRAWMVCRGDRNWLEFDRPGYTYSYYTYTSCDIFFQFMSSIRPCLWYSMWWWLNELINLNYEYGVRFFLIECDPTHAHTHADTSLFMLLLPLNQNLRFLWNASV